MMNTTASYAPTKPQQTSRETSPKVAIRWRTNLMLVWLFTLIHALALFVVPGLTANWAKFALLTLMAVISTPLWALAHEAIHSQLHPQRALNWRGGRWLALLFGSPFRLLRHGHLHHHRHSRLEADRTEIYDANHSSYLAAACAFYPRLLGGLYIGELLANLLFLLPRTLLLRLLEQVHPASDPAARQRAENELLAPLALREIRIDAICVLVLYGTAFWYFGSDWWQLALVLSWRALIISLVDNAFHYATPLNDHLYALNLRLPDWAAPLILNFNMHRTHHRHVSLPWHALPAATQYETEDPRFSSALLRQLRGPIALIQAEQLSLPTHWQPKQRSG